MTIPYSHLKRKEEIDFIKFKKVKCGDKFAYFQDTKGYLYGFGRNRFGELLVKGNCSVKKLKRIRDPDNGEPLYADNFSLGSSHAMCMSDGRFDEIRGWGSCMAGELGISLSKEAMVTKAEKLDVNLIVKNIDREHLLFQDKNLGEEERTYMIREFFGGNECTYVSINEYLLGVGAKFSVNNEKYPVVMEMGRNIQVKQISCGENHTVMVDYNGSVYTWGTSMFGKLGHPNIYGNFEKNDITDKPTNVVSLNSLRIDQVCAGSTFTLVLTDSGECFSIGKFGERRYKANEIDYIKPEKAYAYSKKISGEPIYIKIVCGEKHAGAIDSQGMVYFWGECNGSALDCFNDGKDKPGPTLVEEWVGLKAIDIGCGKNFTICILDDTDDMMKNENYLNYKFANFERIKRRLKFSGKNRDGDSQGSSQRLGLGKNLLHRNSIDHIDFDDENSPSEFFDNMVEDKSREIAQENQS